MTNQKGEFSIDVPYSFEFILLTLLSTWPPRLRTKENIIKEFSKNIEEILENFESVGLIEKTALDKKLSYHVTQKGIDFYLKMILLDLKVEVS